MHELSLMQAVREQALEALHHHGGQRVRVIRLRVGAWAGVEPAALRWAHAQVMAHTAAAHSRLVIDAVAPQWWCAACRAPFADQPRGNGCPRCGAWSIQLHQGRELQLLALEID